MLNFSEVRTRFVLSKGSVCHMEMLGFDLEEGLCFFYECACDSDKEWFRCKDTACLIST